MASADRLRRMRKNDFHPRGEGFADCFSLDVDEDEASAGGGIRLLSFRGGFYGTLAMLTLAFVLLVASQ